MKVSIRLDKSKLKDGYIRLSSDTVINGSRKKQSLGLKYKEHPTTFEEKQDKKEALRLAKMIINKLEMELLSGMYDLPQQYKMGEDFVVYAHSYIDRLRVKETKKFSLVVKRLQEFTQKRRISCYEINESLLRDFAKWLQNRYNGETPNNLFKKLKQITKAATDDLYFRKDPAASIKVKKAQFIQKAVLDYQELTLLKCTPLGNENVKNAFLFCCLTGLHFCDVIKLQWKNIRNDTLQIIQVKTNVPLWVPLNADAMGFLPQRGAINDIVFVLPSQHACYSWLKKWAEAAGIDKNITFHSARHSFGSNLTAHGVSLAITASLMGHISVQHTVRYTHVNYDMKEEAISKLPLMI